MVVTINVPIGYNGSEDSGSAGSTPGTGLTMIVNVFSRTFSSFLACALLFGCTARDPEPSLTLAVPEPEWIWGSSEAGGTQRYRF